MSPSRMVVKHLRPKSRTPIIIPHGSLYCSLVQVKQLGSDCAHMFGFISSKLSVMKSPLYRTSHKRSTLVISAHIILSNLPVIKWEPRKHKATIGWLDRNLLNLAQISKPQYRLVWQMTKPVCYEPNYLGSRTLRISTRCWTKKYILIKIWVAHFGKDNLRSKLL